MAIMPTMMSASSATATMISSSEKARWPARLQSRAGVPPAPAAKRPNGDAPAALGRRDACPTLRFMNGFDGANIVHWDHEPRRVGRASSRAVTCPFPDRLAGTLALLKFIGRRIMFAAGFTG